MLNAKILTHLLIKIFVICFCNAQLHYFQHLQRQQQPAAIYHHRTQLGAHYRYESNNVAALASSPSLVAASPSHPAVIANSLRESELPSELLKSDKFYKNPHIAAALAKESWLTEQEMPVIDREAEKISREEIFKIFHNAGWIKKR